MSVPEGKRGENAMLVHQKADQLVTYTLHITENNKVFDPRQAMLLGMITEKAVNIGMDLWAANNVYVHDEQDFTKRIKLQERAALECNELLYLIRISGPVFHLRKKRVCGWSAKTAEVRNLARKWREKDIRRYKAQLKGRESQTK